MSNSYCGPVSYTHLDVYKRQVMVVAHDPGISELASLLSNDGIDHMPTCAVARFVWNVDSWSEAITHATDSWSIDTPSSLP